MVHFNHINGLLTSQSFVPFYGVNGLGTFSGDPPAPVTSSVKSLDSLVFVLTVRADSLVGVFCDAA
jgi:hypothetical protein